MPDHEEEQSEINFEQVDTTPNHDNVLRKRNCDECGKEYSYKSSHSKTCSEKCRNKLNGKKRKMNGSSSQNQKVNNHDRNEDHDEDEYSEESAPRSSTRLSGNLNGLPAHGQYIITHQQSIINDLKAERERLRSKYETSEKTRLEVEKKLERLELEQTFKTNEKSGLNGVTENPFVLKLLDTFAPALGAAAEKYFNKPASGMQLTGLDLSPETQKEVGEISQWYAKQSPENQKSVYALLNSLAESEPQQLPEILERIINLLQNGISATTSSGQYTSTFN